jgi:hypothetical protein
MQNPAQTAIQAISNRQQTAVSGGSDVTKHVTKQTEGSNVPLQMIEKNGRPVRARTADLHRVKVAL